MTIHSFLRIVIENSTYFFTLQISRCWDKCHNLQSWSGRASLVLTRYTCLYFDQVCLYLDQVCLFPSFLHYSLSVRLDVLYIFSFSDSEIACSIFGKAASTWTNYLELKVISTIPRKYKSKSRELWFLQAPQKWPPWLVKVLFDDFEATH